MQEEKAAPKRQRTESQLNRKRQADRINSRAKREQVKCLTKQLGAGLGALQDATALLSVQLQRFEAELDERERRYFVCPSSYSSSFRPAHGCYVLCHSPPDYLIV